MLSSKLILVNFIKSDGQETDESRRTLVDHDFVGVLTSSHVFERELPSSNGCDFGTSCVGNPEMGVIIVTGNNNSRISCDTITVEAVDTLTAYLNS